LTTLSDQITQWDEAWAARFPKRVTLKNKELFLDELEQELRACSFETTRLSVRYLLQCRLLLTRCENPKVIFTAHYDTPTIMPFWVGAFFSLFGHTRQISGSFILVALLFCPITLFPLLVPNSSVSLLIINLYPLIVLLSFVTLFIPNPHNREDNTSGVIGLMALAEWLKDKPELREQVQLIFFDNEELGLLGSNGLKNYWDKKKYPYREAAVINLDCISRGRLPLLVHHGNDAVANKVLPYLTKHLPQTKKFHLRLLPLSDNYTFREIGAVGISFVEPTLIPGGYQIPKIHSPADNDFSAERLTTLINALTDFIQQEV
jgi:hypothetical protein